MSKTIQYIYTTILLIILDILIYYICIRFLPKPYGIICGITMADAVYYNIYKPRLNTIKNSNTIKK